MAFPIRRSPCCTAITASHPQSCRPACATPVPRRAAGFCALGRSLKAGATIAKKTPEQLAEVAEAAKRLDGVTHVTLTSGTAVNRDEGILYLGKCAQAITERTGLPVQLQFEPPLTSVFLRS